MREIKPIIKIIIKITFIVPLFFSLNASGQESVFVKTVFLPNQKYSNTIITNTKSKINFEKSDHLIAAFKAQGISLPAMINGSDTTKTITSTKNEKNGKIPFVTEISQTNTIQEFNGNKIELNNNLLGTKIYGSYTKGDHSKIDSVINNKLDNENKDLLKSTYEKTEDSFNNNIALKIGDSFKKINPLSLPILGYGDLKFNVTTLYTLKKIENNIAYFSTKMTFELISENSITHIKTTSKGEGIAEFDLQHKFMKIVNSNYNIYAEIKNDNLIMSTDLFTETSYFMEMETSSQ